MDIDRQKEFVELVESNKGIIYKVCLFYRRSQLPADYDYSATRIHIFPAHLCWVVSGTVGESVRYSYEISVAQIFAFISQ